MLTVVILAGLTVLLTLCIVFATKFEVAEQIWIGLATFFAVVFAVMLIIGIITHVYAVAEQISDVEDLQKHTEWETIYQTKSLALTGEFKKYLAEIYPDHERNLFEKMSPENVNLYLVKYPEIQASQTILALVSQIDSLQSKVYEQQLRRSQLRKNIRFRLRNPWYVHLLLAKPEEAATP